MQRADRQRGLDTLRALAIAWVFLYHYQVFVSHRDTFGVLGTVGWVGVDLFFVLSGYLIANSIFGGVVRGQRLSAWRFYGRRGLRTLPVFWLVLALYMLFPAALGGRTPPPLWRFLTFTQNFGLQPGTAFSHAWSLCIEEQFYAVLPLVLLAGAALRCGKVQGWWLLAALWAVAVAARAWLWQRYGSAANEAGYYPHIYYATLCRFDALLPGVAVAMLKHYHAPAWHWLMRHGQRVLVAGVLATALVLWGMATRYYVDGVGYGFAMTVFGYSLMAAAFALLVVAALSPQSLLHRLHVPGAPQLALWSYSIYLSHKAIGVVLTQQGGLDGTRGWTVAAVTLASLAVGGLLYRAVEVPFMVLRERWLPTQFADTAPPAGKAAARQSPDATALAP